MKFEYLFLIFLIKNIILDERIFEFKYTNFFQLFNENYILCTENGIYLYDSQLKNKISNLTLKTEVSSIDDFYFVTIEQFPLDDGGNIVILYKDKFYFYSNEGEYIFSTDLPFQQSGTSCTLVPYKKGEELNIIIGYRENQHTMVGYYKINISNETLSEITTTNIILKTGSNYPRDYSEKGFSCKLMISNQYGEVLACFYVTDYFGLNSYNIEDNFTESSIGPLSIREIKTSYIKTAITPEKDKAIICCSNDQGNVVCLCYDINKQNFTSIQKFEKQIQFTKFVSVTLYYSIKTKELIVSGYNYNGNFTISKFDSELDSVKDEDENDLCKPIFHVSNCTANFVSMIYLSSANGYSMMISCENSTVGIKSYILPESCNPTEITPGSNSNNQNKNFSSDEASISIKKQTTYSLINITIKDPFPSSKTQKTCFPEIHKLFPSTSILSLSSSHFSSSTASPSFKMVSLLSSFLKTDNLSHSSIIANKPSSISSSTFQKSSYKIKTSNIFPIISTSISDDNNEKETNKTIILEPDEECPEQYLYKNKKECSNSCEISQLLNNECSINHITANNIEKITNQMKNILNNTNVTKNTNIVIQGNNIVYQITSSENLNINKTSNISILELGECGTKLKNYYDIDNLIIFKMDLKLNNTPPVIINYEVYNPKNLSKLDLSICESMEITLYSPYTPSQKSLNKIIQLNEYGYDLYNPKDSFYQDICSPFTSENETDILLSDRKSDFFENISLCEDICTYNGYDFRIGKAECKCPIKNSIDLSINKVASQEKNFFANFDLTSLSNIKILKCYNLVFSKLGQNNNIGSCIFIIIIIIFIILSLIFIINKLSSIANILRNALNNIIYSKVSVYSPASPLKRLDINIKERSKRKAKTRINRMSANLLNSKTNLYYVDNQFKILKK